MDRFFIKLLRASVGSEFGVRSFFVALNVLPLVMSTVSSSCMQVNKSYIRYVQQVSLAIKSSQSTSVAIQQKFGTNLSLEMDIGAANYLSEALFLNTNAIFSSQVARQTVNNDKAQNSLCQESFICI